MKNNDPYFSDPDIRRAWRMGWNAVRNSKRFTKGRLSSLYRDHSIGTADRYVITQLGNHVIAEEPSKAVICLYLAWPALKDMDYQSIKTALGDEVADLAAEIKTIGWRGKIGNKPLSPLALRARNAQETFQLFSEFEPFEPYMKAFVPAFPA